MSTTINTNTTNISITNETVVSFYNDGLLVKKDEFAELTAAIKNSQPPDAFNLVTITNAKNILTFIPNECKYELLDLRFLALYLKHNDRSQIDNSKPFVYTLELMDHNVQMVYLDETQSIVFQKDSYIIEDGTKVLTKVEESVVEESVVEESVVEESVVEESVVEESKAQSEEDYDDLPELIDIIEKSEKNSSEAEEVKEKQD
jgi:hypothetical protein